MRITIPTLIGIKEMPVYMREVINILEQLVKELTILTANGTTIRDNVSHEVITLYNQESTQQWIRVTHKLEREPIGVLLQSGNFGSILDTRLRQRSAEFLLAPGSKITVVLM